MSDRRSLAFRLMVLYTASGFVVLVTIALTLVIAAFEYFSRPLVSSFTNSVREVEIAIGAAPATESVEAIQRRIVADSTARGIAVAAISAMAMREQPQRLPIGELSLPALFGLFPAFVPVRDAAIVVLPDRVLVDSLLRWFGAAVALIVALALWAAWLLARLGVRETLRPLLTVTAELERFAGGDFAPRPLRSTGGTELGALAAAYNGAAHNVAQAFLERRRVEDQIRQFVADAGHELRTPLTVVAGYIDVLRRGAFDDLEIRRAAFASLTVEIKRMRTLVERLMTLARLDRVLETQPEVVDVGSIARQAVDALAVIGEAPISLAAPSELCVLGEPADVYEAVANLLENALKYGGRSPIAVTIAVNGATIVVRVRDGGPGVPEEDRSRIFERFYRGTERGDIPGSGLGLAIAAKAAERLSGRIVLEDASPGSTTFALVMPALDGFDPMVR